MSFRGKIYLILIIINNISMSYLINIIYYEMPPFIYSNGNGKLIGILPDIAEKIQEACFIDMNFAVDAVGEKNFSSLMEDPNGIQNYTEDKKKWIWLSLIQSVPVKKLARLYVEEYTLFNSPGVEVVVHRDQIDIFSKILVGLYNCRYLFVIVGLLALIFAAIIWFIECWKNPKFEKSLSGFAMGMWMCVVTLTTVGYGDVTPITALGKFLLMIWMVMAILMSSILTSTMTDSFYETGHLDIYQQNIVAKNGSPGALIARDFYKANVHLVPDYESLFKAIGSKKYMAGVINSDVLSYYHETVRSMSEPLRAVKRLPKEIPVSFIYTKGLTNEDDVTYLMNWCLKTQVWKDILIEKAVKRHRGYIKYDSFDAGGSFDKFLTRNTLLVAMTIITGVFLTLNIILEVSRRFQMRKQNSFDVEKESQ